jgi:DNA-directed RNA polymerase specialized sigma24 family protein
MAAYAEPNMLRAFLDQLDPDPDIASEKLIVLREKLVKIAVWRSCPESSADEVADIVVDRLIAKVAGGTVIGNLPAYAVQVLKFVLLEQRRKNKEDAAGDDLPEIVAHHREVDHEDADERLACLRRCMGTVIENDSDRLLILGYYDLSEGEKIKDNRRELAARLGLTPTNLKVRACRLRDRLERCIRHCLEDYRSVMPSSRA